MDLKIPHDAFVFVGDGRKAMFLRNEGDAMFPYLKTERVFVDENPPSHEQGTERPGRISKGSQTGGRSAAAKRKLSGRSAEALAYGEWSLASTRRRRLVSLRGMVSHIWI